MRVYDYMRKLFAKPEPVVHTWAHIRAHQPMHLQVKLELTKNEFYQGEKIDATITYINTHPHSSYSFCGDTGAWDTCFLKDIIGGSDESGIEIEPLAPFDRSVIILAKMPHGLHVLGQLSIQLPINFLVRLDKPGTYTLFVRSKVFKGETLLNKEYEAVVSEKVTIKILSMPVELEKEKIARILTRIAENDSIWDTTTQGCLVELCTMHTNLAEETLIDLLGKENLSMWVNRGLILTRNPLVAAEKILSRVKDGRLVMNDNIAEMYSCLKILSVEKNFFERRRELESNPKYKPRYDAARKEIMDAAFAASGSKGPAYIEALWTAFHKAAYGTCGKGDYDGGIARREMTKHQLELPEKTVWLLFMGWEHLGGEEFLPIIYREIQRPESKNYIWALWAFIRERREEAIPALRAELSNPDSKLLRSDGYPGGDMCKFDPMPLPEFDSLFRTKLIELKQDSVSIMSLIACFGSPDLLLDVIETYKKYGIPTEYGWDFGVKEYVYRYWFRHDPSGATEALIEELPEGYFNIEPGEFLLNISEPWQEAILPVAKGILNCGDMGIIPQAIEILEKHGDDSCIDLVIHALEDLQKSEDDNWMLSLIPGIVGDLLKSERWSYSKEQRYRLESLISTGMSRSY